MLRAFSRKSFEVEEQPPQITELKLFSQSLDAHGTGDEHLFCFAVATGTPNAPSEKVAIEP